MESDLLPADFHLPGLLLRGGLRSSRRLVEYWSGRATSTRQVEAEATGSHDLLGLCTAF